ncbi:glycosyltransferase family 2 protein [Aureibaculum sp. 2210JD6-5]|uniref:glycosyltransferase family 2 protein n=1 Tax=Aureibaculum sp. 2210JD6-5 TaxID=3103957 RepID=UPI002AAEE943|nr:glycosyltransferase family 2 protein [Aureibaculum sp. 2210JD6-5]MDY7393694.1 glycosyltransferase family 2 protein [Aureibaculum sp. 2210JD6-5]
MIGNNKITAIIPTLNEEDNIAAAIKNVEFADEIIVIDSFSSDNTIEIAQENKVRILQRVFDDFSSQKNFAIDKAKHSWIYVLDADERISDKLKNEIIQTLNNPGEYVGFYIYRSFYFMGKKLRFSGYRNDKVIRLFKKDKCKYDGKLVHENINAVGELSFLKNKIEHYTYKNYGHYLQKTNNYAYLKALSLYKNGKRPNLYHFLIKPPVRFFIHYFFKLGILDGYQGLVMSSVQAYGVFSRYVHLRNLNNKS